MMVPTPRAAPEALRRIALRLPQSRQPLPGGGAIPWQPAPDTQCHTARVTKREGGPRSKCMPPRPARRRTHAARRRLCATPPPRPITHPAPPFPLRPPPGPRPSSDGDANRLTNAAARYRGPMLPRDCSFGTGVASLASPSSGNGGRASGLTASDIKASSLSSPAVRLPLSFPHSTQRWTSIHSPLRFTDTAIASMSPRHPERLSPGLMSTCLDQRQSGQWFRWRVPGASPGTYLPQCSQTKPSAGACGYGPPRTCRLRRVFRMLQLPDALTPRVRRDPGLVRLPCFPRSRSPWPYIPPIGHEGARAVRCAEGRLAPAGIS